MPNKKINALDVKVAVATDLMLVGDPATGTAYKSTLATLPLVPTSRTITINGVAFDLSANRAWTLGTVTSVGLTMPSAFGVANSPITSSGTLAVTALGTASQYIRGDGVLATLPTGGSGGSSISYYLNGGTAASVGTYFQMSQNAVVGTNADFTRTGNGLISQFLTDVGDPNRLQIPAGNWNFEMFFSMSSSGGTPEFYVELLKYDGTTFTSIASSSAIPEVISGGTIIDLYLTSLAIPATILLATDRLALRVYIVNNSGGRTATLHTQDSHLCQIITNFAGGVSALNGLTANTQYFATGTSGTNFAIVSSGDTHTFNLPTASATNRGALSSADWTTFNNKVSTSRTLTINGTAYDLSADRSWTISSDNIYTADGTLTGNRTITTGGNFLYLNGSNTNGSLRINSGDSATATFGYSQIALSFNGTNQYNQFITTTHAVTADNNRINFYTTDGTASNGIANSILGLTIMNGKLGVNKFTPVAPLDVNGLITTNSEYRFNNNSFTRVAIFNSGSADFSGGYNVKLVSQVLQVDSTSGSGAVGYTYKSDGSFRIFTSAGGTTAGNVVAERFQITPSGRLLLGTTTESTFILDVNGTARVNGNFTLSGSYRQLFFTSATSNVYLVGENGDGLYFSAKKIEYADVSTKFARLQLVGGVASFLIGDVTTGAGRAAVASSILELFSTTQGFLPPRMTTTERNAISSPATGLVVYDTTQNSLNTYDGATWRSDEDTITTNRQTASYSLVLADRGKLVEMNSASANTLTIPLNSSIAFPIGSKIDVTQYGAGATTIVATGGVTIRSFTSFLKLAGQYAACTLVKIGTDEWYAYGNLIA